MGGKDASCSIRRGERCVAGCWPVRGVYDDLLPPELGTVTSNADACQLACRVLLLMSCILS